MSAMTIAIDVNFFFITIRTDCERRVLGFRVRAFAAACLCDECFTVFRSRSELSRVGFIFFCTFHCHGIDCVSAI